MMERGYPAQSFDQQVADLSVEHAGTLDSYREAHALATRSPDQQSTEDLRRAIVGYRQLFVDIVGVTPGAATAAQTQAPADVDLRRPAGRRTQQWSRPRRRTPSTHAADAAARARRDPTA